MSEVGDLVEHRGGCHCGAVTWTVLAPPSLTGTSTTTTFTTSSPSLQLFNVTVQSVGWNKIITSLFRGRDLSSWLEDPSSLPTLSTLTQPSQIWSFPVSSKTSYFRHRFCSLCGVQSFYIPRSNQDGVGIMPHCVTSGTIRRMNIVNFDGKDWEKSFKSDSIIKSMSKCPMANE